MRNAVYEDCINYLEKKLGYRFFPYQKDMLKALCEGKEFISARAIGRTFVAECFGKYIAHLYDRNDYTKEPDVIFPYTVAHEDGYISDHMFIFIERQRNNIPEEWFNREYLCK